MKCIIQIQCVAKISRQNTKLQVRNGKKKIDNNMKLLGNTISSITIICTLHEYNFKLGYRIKSNKSLETKINANIIYKIYSCTLDSCTYPQII